MNTNEKRLLQAELNKQGYSVRIDRWPSKATYYKKDGEPMPGLPADPYSMQKYLRRGFTLVPPGKVQKQPEVVEAVISREDLIAATAKAPVVVEVQKSEEQGIRIPDSLTCAICDFSAKSAFGLASHIRIKHSKFEGGK